MYHTERLQNMNGFAMRSPAVEDDSHDVEALRCGLGTYVGCLPLLFTMPAKGCCTSVCLLPVPVRDLNPT